MHISGNYYDHHGEEWAKTSRSVLVHDASHHQGSRGPNVDGRKRVPMSLKPVVKIPNFIEFQTTPFYMFSIDRFKEKVARGRLSRDEASAMIERVHELCNQFVKRKNMIWIFWGVYITIFVLYFYFNIQENIFTSDDEHLKSREWIQVALIWCYLWGTLLMIYFYIKLVHSFA